MRATLRGDNNRGIVSINSRKSYATTCTPGTVLAPPLPLHQADSEKCSIFYRSSCRRLSCRQTASRPLGGFAARATSPPISSFARWGHALSGSYRRSSCVWTAAKSSQPCLKDQPPEKNRRKTNQPCQTPLPPPLHHRIFVAQDAVVRSFQIIYYLLSLLLSYRLPYVWSRSTG